MIIGKGDIASILKDRDDWLFFASGVSNSQEIKESEYTREKELLNQVFLQTVPLLTQSKDRKIVYFSSLAAFYVDSRYYRHKREMEELVKTFPSYAIVRIGNILWGKNPHTLINSMKERVKNGEPLEIRDEYRYVVDKEEFLYWVGVIPEWNVELSIPGRRMKIREIVKEYVL